MIFPEGMLAGDSISGILHTNMHGGSAFAHTFAATPDACEALGTADLLMVSTVGQKSVPRSKVIT